MAETLALMQACVCSVPRCVACLPVLSGTSYSVSLSLNFSICKRDLMPLLYEDQKKPERPFAARTIGLSMQPEQKPWVPSLLVVGRWIGHVEVV